MKYTFFIFTKTVYNEPPRLRHQVAWMLRDRGHDVIFVEKNHHNILRPATVKHIDGLTVVTHPELLHHQLRPGQLFSHFNKLFVSHFIRNIHSDRESIIINFNYDYYFLRSLYPNHMILTIINDDFLQAAKPWMKKMASKVWKDTLQQSNHVFAVSYPLVNKIKRDNSDVTLFLPWANNQYDSPKKNGKRNEILYWGYINNRINLKVVEYLLKQGIKINFVGPIVGNKKIKTMLNHENIRLYGVKSLDEIEEVIVKCCCSILPYNSIHTEITINNRAFSLLAKGLPLLYTSLPSLIECPSNVIYRCATSDDFFRGYLSAKNNFIESQGAIERFLKHHNQESRYLQLMSIVDPN